MMASFAATICSFVRGRPLGLVVTQNLVTVDHAVREHLITTVDGNPKTDIRECGLKVTSLFTRIKSSAKRSRDRKASVIGDNCPLLYALKGKDGLTTNITSIKRLAQSGSEILAVIAAQTQADTVVYMPSGYSLSRIVASRCASVLDAELAHDVFVKSTKMEAFDMIRRAEDNGDISGDERKSLQYRLKKADGFPLKVIPVEYRHLFTPLQRNPAFRGSVTGRVVLVDDLLATGRTLTVAKEIVQAMNGVTSVEAVCLFSDV
ncbi:phosphoribosyltransferase [Pseudomonas laurylsulfatiphila]